MSILRALGFFAEFVGDGVNTVISMDMTKSPLLVLGGSNDNAILNEAIHQGLPVPTGVMNLSSVIPVTGSISGNILTLTFSSAPSLNQVIQVMGLFTL